MRLFTGGEVDRLSGGEVEVFWQMSSEVKVPGRTTRFLPACLAR